MSQSNNNLNQGLMVLKDFLFKSQFYGPSVPIEITMTMIILASSSQFVVWRDQT